MQAKSLSQDPMKSREIKGNRRKCTSVNRPFHPPLSKYVLVALIRGECPHDTASKRYRAISQPLGIFRADTNYFSFGRKFIFVRKEIYFRAEENYFLCGRKSQQERKTYNQLKDNELTRPSSGMQFTPIHPAPTDKEFPIFALRKRKRVPQNKLGTPLHIHSFPQEGGMIL